MTVVTDHGWLLVPGGMQKTDLPAAIADVKKGRCARLKPGAETDVPTVPWHWDTEVRIAIAPGITCFEANKVYEHGGVSPQECVVPRIAVAVGSAPQSGGAEITKARWHGLTLVVEYEKPPRWSQDRPASERRRRQVEHRGTRYSHRRCGKDLPARPRRGSRGPPRASCGSSAGRFARLPARDDGGSELVTELDNLDLLAADVFEGFLVKKDLAQQFRGQYPVPTYVGEFLLGRYCATTDPDLDLRRPRDGAAVDAGTDCPCR